MLAVAGSLVAEDGRAVLACGRGRDGQLGNGTRRPQRVPAQVSGLVEVLEGARVVMVAAGFSTLSLTPARPKLSHGRSYSEKQTDASKRCSSGDKVPSEIPPLGFRSQSSPHPLPSLSCALIFRLRSWLVLLFRPSGRFFDTGSPLKQQNQVEVSQTWICCW